MIIIIIIITIIIIIINFYSAISQWFNGALQSCHYVNLQIILKNNNKQVKMN